VVVEDGNDVVATDAGDLVGLQPDGIVSGLCACTVTGDPIVGLATSSSGELLVTSGCRAGSPPPGCTRRPIGSGSTAR
jgi:hypothetical protein